MTTPKPQNSRHYQNLFMDSHRWRNFVVREGDIIVCTPYKSGTTWVQMICALLIFKRPDLPKPLAEISPWLDLRMTPIDELLAGYAAQTHRRIIKTHTPLDGLPYFEQATYLYCARDPRDVFVSMWNHGKNQRIGHLISLLEKQGEVAVPPPPLPEDFNERFRLWISTGAFPWEIDGFPFWSVFSHAKSFWAFRELSNLHFLHYADLKFDLEGQMRRIAKLLEIEIEESLWPVLVNAATFESMKNNADMTAPDTDLGAWRENAAFFHQGKHEQWRTLLSEENQQLYESVKEQHHAVTPLDWLECGFIAAAGKG